jgi:acetoin utilization protein AcuB
MDKLTLRGFMTRSPHTIGVDQPLARARALMQEHHIRHLPVLSGGKLVGILSDRDLALVATLRADEERVPVSEAMTPDPEALTPETSLEWVAAEMAERRIGSVVVMEHGHVVGIFTTVDALRATLQLCAALSRRQPREKKKTAARGNR